MELSDILSVIGMVASEDNSNDCLRYCLAGTKRNLIEWGHEFLRSLSGEIG